VRSRALRPPYSATRKARPTTARPELSFAVLVAFVSAALSVQAQTLDDARTLHRAGRLTEALSAYRELARTVAADDPASAGTARNNACVILMNTGDHRAALEECREALRLRRIVDDRRSTGRTLNNLGLTLQYLGKYAESQARFEEAHAINVELEDVASQVINWANLGVMATEASWYAKALDYHERALELALQHPDQPWSAEQAIIARVNQAVVFERLGAYRRALELYRGVEKEGEALRPRRRASLYANLGVVYRNLGDPVRALESFEQATEIYQDVGDTGRLSNAYLNMALVRHLNLETPSAAEPAYRKALELAELSGDRAEEIQDLYYLGHLLLDLERPDEAEAAFRRCLEESVESGSSEGRWSSLEGLGRIARTRGDLTEALQRLDEAIDEIETVRSSLLPGALRSDYFGDKRRVYAAAIEVLGELDAGEPDGRHSGRAFELAQRAKARVLLDALGPDASPGEPLSAGDVAERLGSGALVEYFLARDLVFAWIIHDDYMQMVRLGDPGRLLEAAAGVSHALANGVDPQPDSLRYLSASLLGVLDSLPTSVDSLRIAADGALRYLPFEVLDRPGRSGELLVESMTVSYLPSASALGLLGRTRDTDFELGLVGFGDPRIAIEPGSQSTPAYVLASRFELGALPAAQAELQAIRGRLPGAAEIRIGAEATEREFVRLASRGPQVIHIASHTVVDERPGQGTAILLTPEGDSDGLLFPGEIASLDYPVQLTVLAACRTAIGPDNEGSALASLTGAFLAAGSSAVLATLWDVGDEASGVFMRQFYFELGRGHAPSVAVRRVKRTMLADPQWKHLSLWSGYVLIGDSPPLTSPRVRGRRWLVAAILLIALGLVYALLRRRT
jgi:tetratricopeptide (TPR) repeat protein